MSADLVAHLKAENEKLRKELDSSNFMNHQMVGASDVYKMLQEEATSKRRELEIDLARYKAIADEKQRQIDELNLAIKIFTQANQFKTAILKHILSKKSIAED